MYFFINYCYYMYIYIIYLFLASSWMIWMVFKTETTNQSQQNQLQVPRLRLARWKLQAAGRNHHTARPQLRMLRMRMLLRRPCNPRR